MGFSEDLIHVERYQGCMGRVSLDPQGRAGLAIVARAAGGCKKRHVCLGWRCKFNPMIFMHLQE